MDELKRRILDNFHNDIKEYLRQHLNPEYLAKTHDIQHVSGLPPENTPYDVLLGIYYLFRHRFPQGFKKVLWSRELLQNPLFHIYRKNINKIAAIINTGHSLREYLPDDIGNLRRCTFMDKKVDHLLRGWGITHLHLFTRAERQKLRQADKNDDKFLLYVLSTKDTIFFIDVQDHRSMTDKSLLNIINTNVQSSSLIGFMNGGSLLTPQDVSTSDISKLRKMGVGVALGLNEQGDVFMSEMSKHLWWLACAQIDEQLNCFANWCAENYPNLLKDIQNNVPEYTAGNPIDIHIGFGEGRKLHRHYLEDVFVYAEYSEIGSAVLNIPDNQPMQLVSNILKQQDII